MNNARLSTRTPRPTWQDLKLPRLNACRVLDVPPETWQPEPEPDPKRKPKNYPRKPNGGQPKRNQQTGYYGVIPAVGGRYRVTFACGLTTHSAGVYYDKLEAARAHDAYCRAQGLCRPLNFEEES